ncbi:FAD-dependent oxidoreductase [Nostoc sp. NIES-4103]|nr:FAD-dependent oxidoreductase [Nostoc sp. NIES-4103]
MKVIVIGAGIMGLSAAWALQRDGHQVTVYEKGEIPNHQGSSVDQHRLIRFPYGDQLGYTCMVFDAYQAWEKLWRDIGRKFYVQTGTLILAGENADREWVTSSAITLEKLNLPTRWLQADQLKDNFPLFLFNDIESALYLQSGGVLLAEQIIKALSQHLKNRGVTFHTQTMVSEIDVERARIVLANKNIVDADILIVAAGPWINNLLPDFSGRVTPSRQVIIYLEAPALLAAKWARTPMVFDFDLSSGFYMVPSVLGTQIKVGDHNFTMTGTPDSERFVQEAEAYAIYKLCQRRLKNFNQYHFKGARTCFYTVAPQERFIVESKGSSWIMTGFSGHGFKFGPLLGLALAETIAGHHHKYELSQWAAGRSTELFANVAIA